MLHRDRKYFVLIVFAFWILFSCSEKHNRESLYQQYSMKLISENEYLQVFKMANDSVKCWATNNLRSYAYEKDNDWSIDSLLCFNNQKDKVIASLMIRDTLFKPANSDGLCVFYGVKLKEHWYFFNGASFVLPRKFYQKDTLTPLSFSKMHEIAMNNIFNAYLKKKNKGFLGNLFGKTEWEIDDDFFSDVSSAAWCAHCKTQQQWDSTFLDVVRRNWEKCQAPSGN